MNGEYFKHLRINKGQRFTNGRMYISEVEGFGNYAEEWLMKFYRVIAKNFAYYL